MAVATASQNAAEEETALDLPLTPVRPPRSTLRTNWFRVSVAAGTIPFVIPGDQQREMIGIYLADNTSDVELLPLLGEGNAMIPIFRDMHSFEMRKSSYGPMVQDEWTITAPAGADITVCLVTREG